MLKHIKPLINNLFKKKVIMPVVVVPPVSKLAELRHEVEMARQEREAARRGFVREYKKATSEAERQALNNALKVTAEAYDGKLKELVEMETSSVEPLLISPT